MPIGQVIKKLRKERNLTQEELAELLNITSQAVSKWESEAGLPDISQIVPIASVFGVSTDVLFGTFGTSDDEEVRKILDSAYRLDENGEADIKRRYAELQDGLKRYPNHMWLLVNCLETANALCYHSGYDEKHGKEILPECIRMANIIIAYSKQANDVLRAHMIMVILYTAYGNKEKAREHAEKFPWRVDMSAHVMSAYIAHHEKNYADEALHCQRDIMYHFEAMLCDIAQLGEAYRYLKKYGDALKMFNSAFALIKIIFADENFMPPIHRRERGDIHALIARTYLEMGDSAQALEWLEKMVDYDIAVLGRSKDDMRIKTPSLRDVDHDFYYAYWNSWEVCKKRLLKKLNGEEFAELKDNAKFKELLERANNMNEN